MRLHGCSVTRSSREKRPGTNVTGLRSCVHSMMWHHLPQQGFGAGAQQVGATGAQQGSGAGQHVSQLWRRKHFLNIPENRPPCGLLHGSQQGSGSQHTGAGAGAQHGSGCGQQGSQQFALDLKQPNRPASADCGAKKQLRTVTANSERKLLIQQISGNATWKR